MSSNFPSVFYPNENEFQMMQVIARNAANCGLYSGVGSEQKIFMILLAARELGISPMLALNGGIWNIQGRIEISARLMSSMIRKAGHSMKITQCDSTKCVIEGKRADSGDTLTAQFTIEDANRAGLSNRPVWKSYAEDMLYARALSRLARRLFPDIIGTAYVEGEIQDAKCEIISSEAVEENESLPQESVLSDEEKIQKFLSDFEEKERPWLRGYVDLCLTNRKKNLDYFLKKFENKEEFNEAYSTWKKRQIDQGIDLSQPDESKIQSVE